MLWDELQLSTNEEIYMDLRLQGNGHEPGCSNETVATWTPGIPESHLVYSRGKEQEVQLVTPRDKIRIVTVLQPPFMMYDKEEDKFSGYCWDLLKEVAEILK